MSQSRDKMHFVSHALPDEVDEHLTETNNTLMYGIVLLILSIGMVLAFVFVV